MRQLGIGVRVRYIGGQSQYSNPLLYALIGRTGVITGPSDVAGMDWSIEMDGGCLDLDAVARALEPIDDCEADFLALEDEIHAR